MSSTTFSTWYSTDLQANAERRYFEGKSIVNLESEILYKNHTLKSKIIFCDEFWRLIYIVQDKEIHQNIFFSEDD